MRINKVNNVVIASLRIKNSPKSNRILTSIETMSSVYKVTEIKGKGLGCIATVDIEKGSLILTENPQICGITEEEGSSKWIKSLMKSFKKMKKADQLEYMELHSKYNNFQGSHALSFYESEMILDRPNHFGRVPTILGGSNLFWSGANHFGQVQILKISQDIFNLNLTKMIWTQPKQSGPDQNNLYPSKTIWRVQYHF